MPSSLPGAGEAAGGKKLRRRARGTWGRPHPRLRWTPRPNGWTLSGTAEEDSCCFSSTHSHLVPEPAAVTSVRSHLHWDGSPRYLGTGDF